MSAPIPDPAPAGSAPADTDTSPQQSPRLGPAGLPPAPRSTDPATRATSPDGGTAETGPTGVVAGLAREVDGLRRTVAPLLDLPERVTQLGAVAADLVDAVAALTARRDTATCPSWLLLPADPDLAARLLEELSGWLGLVFLRYRDGVDTLPECWAWHPDVVEELLWLMHAWAAAYQGPQASVSAVGDWHDRQRPGVVRRIRAAAGSCSFERHQTRAGWDTAPTAAPSVPGVDGLASIATWWGTHRDQPAPEPATRPAPARAVGGRDRWSRG